MSLASRITDLVTALAAAINVRNVPGASDYQMWLAQGNTGTLEDYRTANLGGDVDYAAQFATQLGPLPATAIAGTKVVPGILRLATAAEAAAGTLDTVAVTPLGAFQAAAAEEAQFRVITLAALNSLAAVAPSGTIVTLGTFTVGGGTHYRSLWVVLNGRAAPYGAIEASSLGALNGVTAAFGGSALPNLDVHPYQSVGIIRAQQFYSRFLWANSQWLLQNPQTFQVLNDAGGNVAQTFNSGFSKITGFSQTHPDWDDTNKIWTAPADGTYMLQVAIRWVDATPASNNVGAAILPAASSGPSTQFGWSVPGSASNGRVQTNYTRVWTTIKGNQFAAFAYVNAQAQANALEFSAVRVGGE